MVELFPCRLMALLSLCLLTCGRPASGAATTAASAFPKVNWDTLSVFWHAADSSGPFNASTLDFIARFPLATIEKSQSESVPPRGTGAEEKIVAAAKQIKERAPAVKVLFYSNSVMDWNMYSLHQCCKQHAEAMWLYDDHGKPVLIFGQNTFNVTSANVRQVWIDTVLTADKSGYIDGAFVDRGAEPRNFANVSSAKMAAWDHGHDLHMAEIQQQLGPDKIVVSNNRDYDGVNARMLERFFLADFDANTPYLDLLALTHEAAAGRLVEAHGEPCTPAVLNATLGAFLVGAGDHAYYACSTGWSLHTGSLDTGWLRWHDEYSRKLGAPLGAAKTISASRAFCRNSTVGRASVEHDDEAPNKFWTLLVARAASQQRHRDRASLSAWIDDYWRRSPDEPRPVFGRRFASGTCVTLDFGTVPPTPCISWSGGMVTGSDVCA